MSPPEAQTTGQTVTRKAINRKKSVRTITLLLAAQPLGSRSISGRLCRALTGSGTTEYILRRQARRPIIVPGGKKEAGTLH